METSWQLMVEQEYFKAIETKHLKISKLEKQNQTIAVFLNGGLNRANVQWDINDHFSPISKSQSTARYECAGVQLSILPTISWTKTRPFPHFFFLATVGFNLLFLWQSDSNALFSLLGGSGRQFTQGIYISPRYTC